jgi:hypothetical protein
MSCNLAATIQTIPRPTIGDRNFSARLHELALMCADDPATGFRTGDDDAVPWTASKRYRRISYADGSNVISSPQRGA